MSSRTQAVSLSALRAQYLPSASSTSIPAPLFRGNRRFHASPTCGKLDRYQRQRYYPPIYPDSLSKTLEVQRQKNRPQLVRRTLSTPKDTDSARHLPLHLKYQVTTETQEAASRKLRPRIVAAAHDVAAQKREEVVVAEEMGSKHRQHAGIRTLTPHRLRRLQKLRQQKQQQLESTSLLSWTVNRSSGQSAQYPWLDHLELPRSTSGLSRLNEEIKAFDAYMSQIPQEQAAAQRIQQLVSQIISQAGLPTPLPYGSRQTGMCLRHSDINFVIPPSTELISGVDNYISRAAEALSSSNHFPHTTTVPRHTFRSAANSEPLIRTTHTATGLPVTLQQAAHPDASSEYVLNYISEFPTLRPLYTILRMILETRSLLGLINHSVEPYGLIMMIVAALKLGEGTSNHHHHLSPFDGGNNNNSNNNNHNNEEDLARQLLRILRFYADGDFNNYGISINPPALFRKRDSSRRRQLGSSSLLEKADGGSNNNTTYLSGQEILGRRSWSRQRILLCLQDPADYMNDLGVGCLRTLKIQKLFAWLYDDIQAGIQAWEEGEPERRRRRDLEELFKKNMCSSTAELIRRFDNNDGRLVSLLHCALGANYDSLERLRDRVVLYLGG